MSWRLLRAIPERVLLVVQPSCNSVPPCGLPRASRFCPIMDAVIKAMSVHYPIFQVAFLRFAFGSLVATAWWRPRPGWPSRETVTANLLRSVAGVITAVSFFYALGQLPLAEDLVLSFLSPMFIALFGLLLLREKVDGRVLVAIAVGFAGTLVVVLGQNGGGGAARSWTGVGAALFSAVTMRSASCCCASAPSATSSCISSSSRISDPPSWSLPSQSGSGSRLKWFICWFFLAMGVLGMTGHMLMTTAYAKAEAARLAPLEYTALIWAACIGYGVFNEIPTWATPGGRAPHRGRRCPNVAPVRSRRDSASSEGRLAFTPGHRSLSRG